MRKNEFELVYNDPLYKKKYFSKVTHALSSLVCIMTIINMYRYEIPICKSLFNYTKCFIFNYYIK